MKKAKILEVHVETLGSYCPKTKKFDKAELAYYSKFIGHTANVIGRHLEYSVLDIPTFTKSPTLHEGTSCWFNTEIFITEE